MKVHNATNIKIYIGDIPQNGFTNCSSAVTAIQQLPSVICPQSIGDLSEDRAISEYKCLSSNESAKVTGAVSRKSLELTMLHDIADMAGQRKIRSSFKDNVPLLMGVEYAGIMSYFTCSISAVSTGIVQDSAVSFKASIEISSEIKECSTTTIVASTVTNNGNTVTNNNNTVVN